MARFTDTIMRIDRCEGYQWFQAKATGWFDARMSLVSGEHHSVPAVETLVSGPIIKSVFREIIGFIVTLNFHRDIEFSPWNRIFNVKQNFHRETEISSWNRIFIDLIRTCSTWSHQVKRYRHHSRNRTSYKMFGSVPFPSEWIPAPLRMYTWRESDHPINGCNGCNAVEQFKKWWFFHRIWTKYAGDWTYELVFNASVIQLPAKPYGSIAPNNWLRNCGCDVFNEYLIISSQILRILIGSLTPYSGILKSTNFWWKYTVKVDKIVNIRKSLPFPL